MTTHEARLDLSGWQAWYRTQQDAQQRSQQQAQFKLRAIDAAVAKQLMHYEHTSQQQTPTLQEDDCLWWLGACAALAHGALDTGHVCIGITSLARAIGIDDEQCQGFLQRCQWVCTQTLSADERLHQSKPLVLQDDRLYVARYAYYEQAVSERLSDMLTLNPVDEALLRHTLDDVFTHEPSNDAMLPNWQKVAAATACVMPLTCIIGGPGTGKTTTLTRLLSALISQHQHGQPDTTPLRIALAAPTGKAASRMLQSIRAHTQDPHTSIANVEHIPDVSHTLHRLLGWRSAGFAHHKQNPLPFDCVVVDEASMVDLTMMHHLLNALAPNARLILLGDRDQLASVEAGSVLADVCDAGHQHGVSDALLEPLNSILDSDNAHALKSHIEVEQAPIQRALAELKHSYRFDAKRGIGQLANAVNAGKPQQAMAALEHFDDIDAHWLNAPLVHASQAYDVLDGWIAEHFSAYRQRLNQAVQGATDEHAHAVFNALQKSQILSALRDGAHGIGALNQRVERVLGLGAASEWYPGRAIMVTHNDADLGVFNGDVGVVLPHAALGDEGVTRLKVAFIQSDGSVRWLLPSRLAHHETAFAMTVHKSQGSEFDCVLLVLPDTWQGLLTKELVYTAITRAKHRFTLLGGKQCTEQSIRTRVERATGLSHKLWRSATLTST